MEPVATVVIPTRGRAGYLEVALASLAPQVRACGAELLVVLDGPDPESEVIAGRHGARVLAHPVSLGLNAARNTALEAGTAPLVCFVDDDIRARAGWLAALLEAHAREPPDVGVLTGPVLARFEGHRLRTCGREGPPITHLYLGDADCDAPHAWGANLAVRRATVQRAGAFDATLPLYGDEQEWLGRVRATGARIRYVAGAAVEHRRAGDDARLRALARAAFARGRAARREDVAKHRVPSLAAELRVLGGCVAHGPRRRCMNGPVLAAHSLGRVAQAVAPVPAPALRGVDDFLSGESGTVGGRRSTWLGLLDRAGDLLTARRRARLRRRARTAPAAQVLVLGVVRTDVAGRWPAAVAELRRSHHTVRIRSREPGDRGKFDNLGLLLAAGLEPADEWVLLLDDDVDLAPGTLDVLLLCAREGDLAVCQPAHRRRSHAAWPVTRRDTRADWRETTFVEIGPVTLLRRDALEALLPLPDGVRMGWGLDVHLSAVARARGLRLGIVDAVPVRHLLRPVAATYPREVALAEARRLLAGRPYVTRDEVRTLARHRL